MSSVNWDDVIILSALGVPYAATQLKNIFRRKEPKAFDGDTCRCGHASTFHDTRGCRKIVTVTTRWNSYGDGKEWEQRECECLIYVSQGSSYIPEIDGLPPAREKEDA